MSELSNKARSAVGLLAARYTGETGFPARDIGILKQYTTDISNALNEGDKAIAELESKNDEIARLTGEIDQLRAELARDPNVSSMQ